MLGVTSWAACDSDVHTGGDAEAFIGQWTFAGASVITVPPSAEIDVTDRVIGRVDESNAVFETDGRFEMVVSGEGGRIENEGTYTVNEEKSTITFDAVGFDETGTFTYTVTDDGNRIILRADDVQFLLGLSGLTVTGLSGIALNAVEAAEIVIFRKP